MCYPFPQIVIRSKYHLELSIRSSVNTTSLSVDNFVYTMSSSNDVCPCCRSNVCSHSSQSVQSQDYEKCRWHSQSSNSSTHFTSHKSYSVHDTGRRTLLLVSVAIILTLPTTMTSPLHSRDGAGSADSSGHRRHSPSRGERSASRPAKWINPCRIPSTVPTVSNYEIQSQSDAEIYEHIVTQVRKAEYHARKFMASFFEESFGSKLENDKYRDLHYDWLASVSETVGKYLGEELDASRLAELKVEHTLRSMYEGLQKFAVGLEQIVLDQAVYGGNFHQYFNEAEFQLKYVLCELQIAMLEKNIQHEDITREIMSETYRDLDEKTTRSLRDWLIFRDYVNTLEYVRQTFSHFLKTSGGRDASS